MIFFKCGMEKSCHNEKRDKKLNNCPFNMFFIHFCMYVYCFSRCLFDLFSFSPVKSSIHCYMLSTQKNHQMLCPQQQKLISTFYVEKSIPTSCHSAYLLSCISLNLPAKHNRNPQLDNAKCDVFVCSVAQGVV